MELAIGYKRFSSPAQARGRSKGRQGDETESYCTRKDYKLIEAFVGAGIGGLDRPLA
jgi:DNA invertase Pin-like site-specific DNA recombinase